VEEALRQAFELIRSWLVDWQAAWEFLAATGTLAAVWVAVHVARTERGDRIQSDKDRAAIENAYRDAVDFESRMLRQQYAATAGVFVQAVAGPPGTGVSAVSFLAELTNHGNTPLFEVEVIERIPKDVDRNSVVDWRIGNARHGRVPMQGERGGFDLKGGRLVVTTGSHTRAALQPGATMTVHLENTTVTGVFSDDVGFQFYDIQGRRWVRFFRSELTETTPQRPGALAPVGTDR